MSVPIAVALLLQVLGSLASAIALLALVRIVDGLSRGTDAVWPAVWWFIGGLGGALILGALALLITHIETPHDNPTTGPLPAAAHCDTKEKGKR